MLYSDLGGVKPQGGVRMLRGGGCPPGVKPQGGVRTLTWWGGCPRV